MEFKNTSWGILSVSNMPWASLGKFWLLSFSIKLILREYWIMVRILWSFVVFFQFLWKWLIFTLWKVSVFGVFLVRIFPHFSLSLRILSECEKIRARKTPNIDTFTKWFPAAKLGWTSLLSFDHLLPLWLGHLSPEAELIQEGWESFKL